LADAGSTPAGSIARARLSKERPGSGASCALEPSSSADDDVRALRSRGVLALRIDSRRLHSAARLLIEGRAVSCGMPGMGKGQKVWVLPPSTRTGTLSPPREMWWASTWWVVLSIRPWSRFGRVDSWTGTGPTARPRESRREFTAQMGIGPIMIAS